MIIKIISQTEELFSGTVESVTAPTVDGDITILPKHANLITILEVGLVKVVTNDVEKEIVLNGGILEVKSDEIIILANEASLRNDLVEHEIDMALKSAEGKIVPSLSQAELARLEKEIRYHKFRKKMVTQK
jgi:F-type H+-transporting ATPase subunit epsilon